MKVLSSNLQCSPLNTLTKDHDVYLRAAVVQDLDVSTKGLVHDIYRHVITVGQVPQQVQNFVGHHPVFVVFSQASDEFQQLLTLFFASIGPAGLQETPNGFITSTCHEKQTTPRPPPT